jgi:hypothetical protein
MMARFIGFLLLVGFIGAYFGWIILAAAAVLAVYGVMHVVAAAVVAIEDERARQRALVSRCDQQHAWVMQGDPRGTYGR